MEIWKDIEGYEGIYQVSNCGRIKGLQRFASRKSGGSVSVKETIRKQGNNGHGYAFVPLSSGGVVRNYYVHRLVATAFIPNPERKNTVNHISGIKADNRVENLEWATQSENSQHGFDTGLIVQNRGKDNPGSRPVLQFASNGELVAEYVSLQDAFEKTGIHSQNIGCACTGKYMQSGGFTWKYKEAKYEKV